MRKTIKTGDVVQVSGQYQYRGSKHEYTFVKGKRVPPTKDGATEFILVDKTRHKGGTSK